MGGGGSVEEPPQSRGREEGGSICIQGAKLGSQDGPARDAPRGSSRSDMVALLPRHTEVAALGGARSRGRVHALNHAD